MKYGSVRIAIGFTAILAIVYFGYQIVASRIIDSKVFPEIKPGKVTLLGITTGGGYKIIVANEIAHLVQSNGKFEAGDMEGDSDSGSDKRRIPLKELLQTLQGDENALTRFVTVMNDDLHKAEIPPSPVIWDSSDIQKAIDGDKALQKKLEHDINANLAGKPAGFININALYNGIVLRVPVPITVSVAGKPTKMVAKVLVPYRANFTRNIERTLTDKGLRPSDETIKGYYLQEAHNLESHKTNVEDIAASLASRMNADTVKGYAASAEPILADTKVVLNDSYIRSASIGSYEAPNGKPLYDLELQLTEEGRERLWQYSRHRVGTQLLLIVDGVAIGAPRVRHELAQSNVNITQMPDKDLVQDAVDVINSSGKTASNP